MTNEDYEAPKAVRMDSIATGAGGDDCVSGSGNFGHCNSGSGAGSDCVEPGNNPGANCYGPGNGDL